MGMQDFMQSQQGMPNGAPPMPPQASPQQPQGIPNQSQRGMPPQMSMHGQPPISPPQQLDPKIQQLIQMLISKGRGGDTLMAHLTPGEMEVPPEIQTPKVLATLKKAYNDKGVSPEQFTAGSPQSSNNPSTGLPEYNFMSAFLPAALGIAGSVAAPYLAPELMSATMAGSIGAGLGTTAGGLLSGQKPTQAALSGIGAGAGGYLMGNIGNGLTAGGNLPTGALPTGAPIPGGVGPSMMNPGLMTSGQVASQNPGFMGAITNAAAHPNFYSMAGSTIGGQIGNSIGAPNKPHGPIYPPGFNNPMTPFGQLGSAQSQLGQNVTKQPQANFTGYNPFTNSPAAYNFFPGATSGA